MGETPHQRADGRKRDADSGDSRQYAGWNADDPHQKALEIDAAAFLPLGRAHARQHAELADALGDGNGERVVDERHGSDHDDDDENRGESVDRVLRAVVCDDAAVAQELGVVFDMGVIQPRAFRESPHVLEEAVVQLARQQGDRHHVIRLQAARVQKADRRVAGRPGGLEIGALDDPHHRVGAFLFGHERFAAPRAVGGFLLIRGGLPEGDPIRAHTFSGFQCKLVAHLVRYAAVCLQMLGKHKLAAVLRHAALDERGGKGPAAAFIELAEEQIRLAFVFGARKPRVSHVAAKGNSTDEACFLKGGNVPHAHIRNLGVPVSAVGDGLVAHQLCEGSAEGGYGGEHGRGKDDADQGDGRPFSVCLHAAQGKTAHHIHFRITSSFAMRPSSMERMRLA